MSSLVLSMSLILCDSARFVFPLCMVNEHRLTQPLQMAAGVSYHAVNRTSEDSSRDARIFFAPTTNNFRQTLTR